MPKLNMSNFSVTADDIDTINSKLNTITADIVIKAEDIAITVAAGVGNANSATTFSNQIWLVVAPATGANTYDLTVTENATGYVLLQATELIGTQLISSLFPAYNSTVNVAIAGATINEAFAVQIRYR